MEPQVFLYLLAVLFGLQTEIKGIGEDKVHYVYKYRVVNWCVTGNNEPALYEWPFVQFKPFLQKTSRFAKYDDVVDIPADPYLGNDTEGQEAHNSYVEKPPAESKIVLRFKRINCEHPYYPPLPPAPPPPPGTAPPLVGALALPIPAEQTFPYVNPNMVPFATPPYRYRQIDPIGHHSHPTQPGSVGQLYNNFKDTSSPYVGSHLHQRIHIELQITNPDSAWEGVEGVLIQANHAPFGMGFPFGQFYRGEDTEGDWPCKCSHSTHRIIPCLSRPDIEIATPTIAAFHFEMLEYGKEKPDQAADFPKKLWRTGKKKELHFNFKWHSHPCSSANLVTFFVLVVHSFYQRKYEIRTFGPYDFSPLQLSNPEFLVLGKGRRPYRYEAREDAIRFNNLRWLVPLSDPADTSGVHKRFRNDEYGAYTRAGYVQNPFYMPSPLLPHCRRQTLVKPSCKPDATVTPPITCDDKWTLACHDEPYVPTENRYYFPLEVKPGVPPSTRANDGKVTAYQLRFNGIFDTDCLSNYPLEREAHHQCTNWTGLFRCDERYEGRRYKGHLFTYRDLADRNKLLQTKNPENQNDQFFDNTMCKPCKYEATTAAQEPTPAPVPFIKRSLHGALMVVAFIYLMPVSMLIARYYKETVHTCEAKGFRVWLWLHIGISIFAMALAYAGYNLPTFWKMDRHMWLGYAAMFSGGSGLVTGWGRHKNKWLRTGMYWLHSTPSYGAVACAACSMFWSPGTQASFWAQWTIIGCVILYAIVMFSCDCRVYVSDKKLGMYPPRPHVPILEVRFEDSFIRGHKCRLVFLYIFVVVLLLPILVSMCI